MNYSGDLREERRKKGTAVNNRPWRAMRLAYCERLLVPRRRGGLLILDFEFVYDLFDIRHLCHDFFDRSALRLRCDAPLQRYDAIFTSNLTS